MNPDSIPDPAVETLRRWQAGDQSALAELLAETVPWLQHKMRQSLGAQTRGVQDSLDLAQSAVVDFLTWGPRFVPNTMQQFRALLARIANNGLIDHQRRRQRVERLRHFESLAHPDAPLSAFGNVHRASGGPGSAAERGEDQEWVRLALQFLDADDRALLLLREVEGLDWAAVATELGIESPDAARVRCARVKPRLARVLLQLRRGWMPEEG